MVHYSSLTICCFLLVRANILLFLVVILFHTTLGWLNNMLRFRRMCGYLHCHSFVVLEIISVISMCPFSWHYSSKSSESASFSEGMRVVGF